MLGVCLFYLFNALDSQALVQGNGRDSAGYCADDGGDDGGYLRCLFSVVLGCLILYANSLSCPNGAKRNLVRDISGDAETKDFGVLALEPPLIGLFSLAVGLALRYFSLRTFYRGIQDVPKFNIVNFRSYFRRRRQCKPSSILR